MIAIMTMIVIDIFLYYDIIKNYVRLLYKKIDFYLTKHSLLNKIVY